MELSPQTVATIALVMVFVMDKILSLLKSRGIDLRKLSDQVDDLHNWHNKEDDEGVKIWYVRRSLEEAIIKLADNIALELKVLEKMDRRMERIEAKLGD